MSNHLKYLNLVDTLVTRLSLCAVTIGVSGGTRVETTQGRWERPGAPVGTGNRYVSSSVFPLLIPKTENGGVIPSTCKIDKVCNPKSQRRFLLNL